MRNTLVTALSASMFGSASLVAIPCDKIPSRRHHWQPGGTSLLPRATSGPVPVPLSTPVCALTRSLRRRVLSRLWLRTTVAYYGGGYGYPDAYSDADYYYSQY